MLRILLADDHEIVREGIKMLIDAQDDMEVVGEAENGNAAIEKMRELSPDIIVMDISMPELNGMKATRRIMRKSPNVKILTLSRHSDDGYLQQLIQAGVSGYILKQSAPTELIRAIRQVGSGKKYVDPTLTDRVMSGYISQKSALDTAQKVSLTDRETEVVRLIAWGYSNREIGEHLQISVKTVEAHKANSMRKLGIKSRIDIVRYAILQGWMENN